MIGRVINDEFSQARDWPMASAVAVALLSCWSCPMMLYTRYEARDGRRVTLDRMTLPGRPSHPEAFIRP